MPERSAGDGVRRLPRRSVLPIFLAWGFCLSALQAGFERTATAQSLIEGLARLIALSLPFFGAEGQANGALVQARGEAQPITLNCLALTVIVVYAAAILATPARWTSRGRGFALGLAAILVMNPLRLMSILLLGMVSVAAFRFGHVAGWGALAPIVLLALWGIWVVRGLRLLPAYPVRLVVRVAVVLPITLAAWYYLLDHYLIAVTTAINTTLVGLGVPVRAITLVQVDLYRFLDVAFADRGLRLELATTSVNLVAVLALVLASPVSPGPRVIAALVAVAALFALHVLGSVGLFLAGYAAPMVAPPLETFNDFLNLAAPGVLWLYLLGDRLFTSPALGGRAQGTARRSAHHLSIRGSVSR